MAKKAPFFSHDMNARYDPKMSAMRGVYGAEGYGWFWMLIEMMAEADGYQLDYKSKYVFNAYAMQLQCKPEQVSKFVSDCIDEFELFASDDSYFWSNSLRKRMQYRDSVSEKRAAAANKRWENQQSNANASNEDANAMQSDANKTKQNKTKLNYQEDDISPNQLILGWINKYSLKCKGVNQLEEITSFVGIVDIEVIELAIKKAEKKNVPYAIQIIQDLISEGKTTKESVQPSRVVKLEKEQKATSYQDHVMKLQQEMRNRNEYADGDAVNL
ncbi:DUF4373 domain-containing protein [Paenibacillus sabinae]|uniref:Lin1244/Lin1753-like N-terminal domain-containing protein n=1 Tax=Paenibacillus sabinae T27 TaxID=1268072 RepID=X4Z8U3_9BACL|nr:DUF4373 domain-containing protein [Paenibacillus sabinae]AHV96131.1 hypothetical protein PSAB_05975 [Paenibacillus sabinae T27]